MQTVNDGEAALAAIETNDARPGTKRHHDARLDGIAMLKAIRANPSTSGLPVVLLTARADEESTVEGMEAAQTTTGKALQREGTAGASRGHIEIAKVRVKLPTSLRK